MRNQYCVLMSEHPELESKGDYMIYTPSRKYYAKILNHMIDQEPAVEVEPFYPHVYNRNTYLPTLVGASALMPGVAGWMLVLPILECSRFPISSRNTFDSLRVLPEDRHISIWTLFGSNVDDFSPAVKMFSHYFNRWPWDSNNGIELKAAHWEVVAGHTANWVMSPVISSGFTGSSIDLQHFQDQLEARRHIGEQPFGTWQGTSPVPELPAGYYHSSNMDKVVSFSQVRFELLSIATGSSRVLGLGLEPYFQFMREFMVKFHRMFLSYSIEAFSKVATVPVSYRRKNKVQVSLEQANSDVLTVLHRHVAQFDVLMSKLWSLKDTLSNQVERQDIINKLQQTMRNYIKWLVKLPGAYEDIILHHKGPSLVQLELAEDDFDTLVHRFLKEYKHPVGVKQHKPLVLTKKEANAEEEARTTTLHQPVQNVWTSTSS